jgi:hypothetical protein
MVLEGKPRDLVLQEHETWLREGKHKSKDLIRRRETTIRNMMKAARRYTLTLERKLADGTYFIGSDAKVDAALSTILEKVRLDHQVRRWRSWAEAQLNTADLVLISASTSAWEQATRNWVLPRLKVLVGLLRVAAAGMAKRPLRRISLAAKALKSIAGGRGHPPIIKEVGGCPVEVGGGYRILVTAAETLGYLKKVAGAQKGRHAAVYEVTLPEGEPIPAPRAPRRKPTKKCRGPGCGKPLADKRGHARYCSTVCRKRAWRAAKAARRRKTKRPTPPSSR